MKIKATTIFTLFLLLLVFTFLIIAASYPKRASVGPLAAGIPAALLLITQIILDLKRKTESEEEGVGGVEESTSPRDYAIALTWIAGMLVGSYFFGLLIVFPLFTAACIKANGWGWPLSLSLGAGIFVLLYGVFGFILQVTLYAGVLLE